MVVSSGRDHWGFHQKRLRSSHCVCVSNGLGPNSISVEVISSNSSSEGCLNFTPFLSYLLCFFGSVCLWSLYSDSSFIRWLCFAFSFNVTGCWAFQTSHFPNNPLLSWSLLSSSLDYGLFLQIEKDMIHISKTDLWNRLSEQEQKFAKRHAPPLSVLCDVWCQAVVTECYEFDFMVTGHMRIWRNISMSPFCQNCQLVTSLI